ncbi:polyribonucleotide nucleotidyltransferase [Dehalococcoides mccartyi]|uniref:Polyribonucleotide nucleotidyltransferase n=1 Tax=Dehalococcoides mccartyi (strain ATCC BAA-2266 / KCTC 15142 / 195) TaxID=243164 RepID=PNP_DEHM1|nr:polyribonucleotide nucleotidyltransferase [Dehalococcoides mccartyi]Q3Z7V6.1 RecName: Full=Polyribonucleotide nucleotidyltransferase; AltName: Full=Polynucleotide phosphorylase; Short=PNPase [Dehalococcoides mccartyi 195]AAW39716.1 polyribonucleotide nucleotidyltransferase [Dehalococcoides mccartyi 195]
MITANSFERTIGGRKLTIESGKMARLADAAVTIRYADTELLVTLCAAKKPREGVDFLPLTIDYEERMYAAGKIPGGFIRREGRPSEQAILAGRLTDRPLRPLLPKEWRNELQIIITVIASDKENDADIWGVVGASTVLTMSQIPYEGPVGASRVGYTNGEFVLNPTFAQLEQSQMDLVVVSTRKAVVMIEAGSKEIPEDLMIKAIEFAHQANQELIDLQDEIRAKLGKEKLPVPVLEIPEEVKAAVAAFVKGRVNEALSHQDKTLRENAVEALQSELVEALAETYAEGDILAAYDKEIKKAIRSTILEKDIRVNGRGIKQLRQLDAETGILPRVHGSALFTRGDTQVMAITTLGSLQEAQQLDGLSAEDTKRFMLHYNFAPFSTGEVKRSGSPGRREIGHGALAERALVPVLPTPEEFPYTIRMVADVVGSSGSTSMGSVCSSSLSLMDAGVPVKKAVAGISIGLITGENDTYCTITDIEGIEDNYGDMDFKVAGTRDGITAIQVDMKVKGISFDVIRDAIYQAKEARYTILEVMDKALAQPKTELSPYAPRMYKISIDPSKIGSVIGSGGKTIRSIIEQTNTTVDIENDGTVVIGATDEASAQKAIKIIEDLTKDVEAGSVYTGKVTRIMTFGAFVEILPGKEGMVHISELADHRVEKVEDVVKVGDEITVKVTEIDSQGRINLSRRVILNPNAVPISRNRDSQPRRSGPFRPQDRSNS